MKELKSKVFDLRKDVLTMIYNAKTGHIGGDFSVMDILSVLYFKHMNISTENMEDYNRDYFVMSKGHSMEAYYAVLAEKGFIDREKVLNEFSSFGSKFIGHPNNKLPGIEMNSGSLGHGLPVCVGIALAAKKDNRSSRVYTVMGDGELAEGSVWEGFMAGGHFKLDNLCAVIDRNKLQISGYTEDVMGHENLEARISSFRWHVIRVNGNDVEALDRAFEEAKTVKGMPTCIIADTVKGFGGGSIMENKAEWHHKVPSKEEFEIIASELERRKAEVLYE